MHLKITDLPEREPDAHPEASPFQPYLPSPAQIWKSVLSYSERARMNGQTKTAKEIFVLGADLVLQMQSVEDPS